jgi:hypothetical protein
MRIHLRLAAVSLLALGSILLFDSRPDERARIQAHLERIEHELRSRDVSSLSPAQRAARARNLSALRDYRRRGDFPHNHDFGDRRMPYFVDRHGTRCAVAYLIEQSGERDLVRRVAMTSNNARIRELASDAELLAWLDREGLTVAEAAMIQPEYGDPIDLLVQPSDSNPAYTAATVGATGLSAIAIALNMGSSLADHDRGKFATAMGIIGLGLGVPAMAISDDPLTRSLGAVNAGVGAMSLLVGITTLRTTEPSTANGVTVAAAPVIARGPVRANGAALHLRF